MSSLGNIGLGLILAKINFNVGIKGVHSGHGYQMTRSITFRAKSPDQEKAAQVWAEEMELPVIVNQCLGRIDDIRLWLDALSPYTDLLTNKKNYERMMWALENPMPKAHEPFDSFLEWAALWDAKNEEFEISYINQQQDRQ